MKNFIKYLKFIKRKIKHKERSIDIRNIDPFRLLDYANPKLSIKKVIDELPIKPLENTLDFIIVPSKSKYNTYQILFKNLPDIIIFEVKYITGIFTLEVSIDSENINIDILKNYKFSNNFNNISIWKNILERIIHYTILEDNILISRITLSNIVQRLSYNNDNYTEILRKYYMDSINSFLTENDINIKIDLQL